MSKKYYITTPIYYVNDVPHIGHAYTTVACDALARFMRLDGRDVKFLTGTDEHGQKVAKSATKRNMSTQDFVDELSQHFRVMTRELECSHDDFIRTTQKRHVRAVEELWRRLGDNIYLGSYSGWYAMRDESFYQEDEITDGKAPTGATVEWIEEPSYFFNLSQWQSKLLEFYNLNPDFVKPASKFNEVISFVKSGLRDLSVSRLKSKLSWGISVPDDAEHVIYVWLDALTNYLSALNFPDTEGSDYRDFWNDSGNETTPLHVVGKDILRFHAVYWPAFLMAAGLPLPKRIMAHGWWTNQGQKISKSVGNVIDPLAIIKDFGLDQVRYFLLRAMLFGNDGDFSKDSLVAIVNAELANNVGNLVQRTLSMLYKYFDGRLPEEIALKSEDNALLDASYNVLEELRILAQKTQMHNMIEKIISISTIANRYVDSQAPWLIKNDRLRLGTVLYTLAESIRCIAILLQPFVPNSAGKILDHFKLKNELRDFCHLKTPLSLGGKIENPEIIFTKL